MKFNENMLTLAKDAAGLTQSAIAAHVGVSQSIVSKVENGFEVPSDVFVGGVADLAGVPKAFFFQHDDVMPETLFDMFHKKRLTLPQKPLKRANACAQVTRLQVGRLLRSFDVPITLPFPNLPIDAHESADEVAALTRSIWRIPTGPIADLVAVVEATGTPVVLLDLGHEKLRAISMPGAKSYGTHMIMLNSRLPASAQRFALAHEVGHLVMHEGIATPEMEKEADDFASALLMPAETIGPKLRNVRFRDLGMLKIQWRVSLAALIYRANALGLISERHYRTLNVELNRLPNGRKREPGEFAPEEPRLVRRVIEAYLGQGYTVDELSDLMVMREVDLRRTYLGESIPNARLRSIRSLQA